MAITWSRRVEMGPLEPRLPALHFWSPAKFANNVRSPGTSRFISSAWRPDKPQPDHPQPDHPQPNKQQPNTFGGGGHSKPGSPSPPPPRSHASVREPLD